MEATKPILHEPTTDERMDIVIVGHVDHGKSTVIGRLLADTDSLPKGKLEQVRKSCERNSRPFEYAFLIDALKDERAQNITIDSARVFFKSPRRRYIIIDAPGHIEFVRNMVTGASRAEAALLVIDAEEGVQENSRRHSALLSLLGIRQVVVLINKMDLAGYQQSTFERVCSEFQTFLDSIGVQPIGYIPVSAREGENIAAPGAMMPWYNGPTVLEALDGFEKARPLVDRPFRMPVQDVYRFTQYGDDRRIVAGTIASGTLRPSDEVVFYPSGKRSRVKTIEHFNRPPQESAEARQAVGFTLEQQIYVQRGEIAARADQTPPRVTRRLRASLLWLGKHPMTPGKTYLIKLGTAKIRAEIESIERVIDAASNASLNGKVQIEHHEVAEVIFTLQREMAFDLSETLGDTSRFVVVDDYEICGGGLVLEALPDEATWVRENVLRRNERWIQGAITNEQRAERYNQRSALVIITGKRGVGRKRYARALEERLFLDGKFVYYLGMGSVVYGVDADLKRNGAPETQAEHIRRMSEVAHIFLDAGVILILTAVELSEADLQVIRAVIDPNKIEIIWAGGEVTTDIAFGLRIESGTSEENAVVEIKHLLQERGIIFRP